jgi:carbon storage regulator CsrA
MLVLSRKPQETIVFPHLGVTIEVIRVAGGKVRVGVEAPADISVLRGELVEPGLPLDACPAGSASHRFRNRLHTAGLALKLMEKQLAAGLFEESEQTLQKALDVFQQLNAEAERAKSAEPSLGRSVLLVEDDANEAELMAGILRLSGYRVRRAADGLEAIDALELERPDFVLLDMNMPRCDGRATLSAIRKNPAWRDLPVFAVSGASQDETGVELGKPGVDRWFRKPLDPESLLGAIGEPQRSLVRV